MITSIVSFQKTFFILFYVVSTSYYYYYKAAGLSLGQSSRRQFVYTTTSTIASSVLIHPITPCNAETETEKLKRIYDTQASTYEELYSESIISRKLDFDRLRENLLSNAKGNVLELGVGTGLNLSHYPDNNDITSYTAIDLSPKMLEQAKLKFEMSMQSNESKASLVSSSLQLLYRENKVSFQLADVEKLSTLFPKTVDGQKIQFDTIIDTFGLCVFPNPQIVLQQARDILSPHGQLLLLEHQDSMIAKVLSPTRNLSDVSNTCRYNDDVRGLIQQTGFDKVEFEDLAGGFLINVIATKSS